MINSRGDVVGLAENNTQDPGCPVHRFEPVVWENGKIRRLPRHADDLYGVAAQINDIGQVVGASGNCAAFNPYSGLYLVENYALLWKKTARSMISATSAGLAGSRGTMLVRSIIKVR